MSIIRYTLPELGAWSPLSTLRDQFGRILEMNANSRAESFGEWTPALDAFEDKDKYIVQLEVPGMKKSDLNVTVQDGVLTISGERNQGRDFTDGTTHRTERFYGKFSRSVTLPAAVKTDAVAANYKDGILVIELPKAEEAKPKQIDVKIS